MDVQTSNTIRAIQELNAARSARWMAGSPGWTTLEIAGELAGEVGELANICKKLRRSEMGVPGNKVSDDELREQARGEIADVFIVLMLTASKLGIDLEDAVRETFNRKSEQMGFPERIPDCAAGASEELELYRRAAWSWQPEDGDGGFDRIGWLSCLLSTVRGTPAAIELLQGDDPSAFQECLSECDYLFTMLREAVSKLGRTPLSSAMTGGSEPQVAEPNRNENATTPEGVSGVGLEVVQ